MALRTGPGASGIFVYDTDRADRAWPKTPNDFDDFVYWNFSGRTPGTGEGDNDGELARWRSAELRGRFRAGRRVLSLFDADLPRRLQGQDRRGGNGAYGIRSTASTRKPPWKAQIVTVVKTGMDGTLIDPEPVFETTSLPVTEMGLERDGFRGNSLAINVGMGTEEAGWAGIYLTKVK